MVCTTVTATPAALLADIKSLKAVWVPLLDAYFRKERRVTKIFEAGDLRLPYTVTSHVYPDGTLTPLTIAALEVLLKEDEWANSPLIKKMKADAKKAEKARKADEEKRKATEASKPKAPTADELRIEREMDYILQIFCNYAEKGDAFWCCFYNGGSVYTWNGATTIQRESISPHQRLAAERLVAEGRAPSRKLLGLAEQE